MSRWIPTLAALAVAAVLAVPAIRHWRERPPAPPPPPEPIRSAWVPPDPAELGGDGDYVFGLSLAPDGRKLVYPALYRGQVSLWLHDLRTGSARQLPDTDGAAAPFWSPDGRRVGFFAHHRLRMFDEPTERASDIVEVRSGRGAAWNGAGDLVYASAAGGLMVRDAGGSIKPLTTLDATHGEQSHTWPAFLPDGRQVAFLVTATQPARSGIWIARLDDPSSRRRVTASDSQAVVVNHTLLFVNDTTLMAQALDPLTAEPLGRAAAIASGAGRGPLAQLLATAANDVLIYGQPPPRLRQLQWVDRNGQQAGPISEPNDAWDLRIAPEGRRFVVTEVDRQLRTLDVFIRTAAQPAPTRLSLSTDGDESGVWSPDGLRVAWAGQRRKVMMRGAGAVLPEQTLATFDTPVQVWDWSRDGQSLLIGRQGADTGEDLWIQPPTEGAAAQPYFVGPFNQSYAALSPDGRLIAYASDESGQFDVYVDTFPKGGNRIRATTAGGTEPRWSATGRELYFRRGSEIHAIVLINSEVRSMTRLFDAGAPIRAYDVSRDGRFLINVPAATPVEEQITMITHWQPRT
ncbi:MAG TPA: hypothetical protein VEC39_02275 [Vicinamibacterales bacterium]|nr:hypothetical protein [Vicinamibacterales bacterium]